MATLRCKEPFACVVKGVPQVVPAGTLVDSSDPRAVGREHLFEAVDEYMDRREAHRIEQATADPGELRVTPKRRRKPSGDDES